MTTMTYYLPQNTPIQAKGIKPDITINHKILPPKNTTWLNDLYGKEALLKNHIPAEEAKDNKQTDKKKKLEIDPNDKEALARNWEKRYREAITQDIQIQSCINMINLLKVARAQNPEQVDSRKKALAFLKEHYISDDEVELEKI